MPVDVNQLIALVVTNIEHAIVVADEIQLETRNKYASAGMLSAAPDYAPLPLGWAKKTWGATLFVDLRGSTKRAVRIGARDTFITMQAYIPAMAQIIGQNGGYIVGFRGDGIFAAFGVTEAISQSRQVAVRNAGVCGQCMLDAVHNVINDALEMHDVEGGLEIGIGIDVGEIVVTRIGLPKSFDLTAYGDSVNNAAHLADEAVGQVLITNRGDALYPEGPNGRVTSVPADTEIPAAILNFPEPFVPSPDWSRIV